MREVIAVCRSRKKSRQRVARVLDRYFWRIGDRTWRGRATNACLDRMSRELRAVAVRNTAVAIHEIRSAARSRVPIIMIGSRHAFSETGLSPVASNPSEIVMRNGSLEEHVSALIGVAALFHDLGKATVLFQSKLRCAIEGGRPKADPVRHDLFSACVWDTLFGNMSDTDLTSALRCVTSAEIDVACAQAKKGMGRFLAGPGLEFRFLNSSRSLTYAIGMLILTHHRLPDGDSSMLKLQAGQHVSERNRDGFSTERDLAIASGTPFWHRSWWLESLKCESGRLDPKITVTGVDMALRASLMFADHLGSREKSIHGPPIDNVHIANTALLKDRTCVAADSLDKHVKRVHRNVRDAFSLFSSYRDTFPALDSNTLPTAIANPLKSKQSEFKWQFAAVEAARDVCTNSEGGFFACIVAGTGTGKTRGAPTILAAAALADSRTERRYFRMCLGLGLRVLAVQSAAEYVKDLGFGIRDVSVLVGQTPLDFSRCDDVNEFKDSESLSGIPEWLRTEYAEGSIPQEGSAKEGDWLRTLSCNTDRGLPAFCDLLFETGRPGDRRLMVPPVMVGTIDHIMSVASPARSGFIFPALRVATSDLVLDEIDQYDAEDIAVIGRLVFQAASMGRRLIVMSATLTPDIAVPLYQAYRLGWSEFCRMYGLRDHVNLLVTGETPCSCLTNSNGIEFESLFNKVQVKVCESLKSKKPIRRAIILPAKEDWGEIVDQIDSSCSKLHSFNAVGIGDFRVSIGMVRLTRISHVAAMAVQIPSGHLVNRSRLRVPLCLHSNFPRLLRSWIEARLKRALVRKGPLPDAGVLDLCKEEKLFERANELGVKDIEIVVVTSPVIETGTDLDFDWAVLDPVSTRSIIQSAGRVRRHRESVGDEVNVHILGRSPIVMQSEQGRLEMPGVETRINKETLVGTPSLECKSRDFRDLSGKVDFSVIDASLVLSEEKKFPLRDAEVSLRRKMINVDHDSVDAPLGRYITCIGARMNLSMMKRRRFRRSEMESVLFKMVGERFCDAVWYMDLFPGLRESCMQEASRDSLDLGCGGLPSICLFNQIVERAWLDYSGSADVTSGDIGRLMRVEIPNYSRNGLLKLAYNEFTGFTRGKFDDLFEPFGKMQ